MEKGSGDLLGALQFFSPAAGSFMTAAALAHQVDVGAGDTDVAQQVVVELQQVAERLSAFRTAEQGSQVGHWISHWLAVIGEAAYAVRWMNVL
jgi:hypothetical protein